MIIFFILFEFMLVFASWRLAGMFGPRGNTEKAISVYLFYFLLLGFYTQSLSLFKSLNSASFFIANTVVFCVALLCVKKQKIPFLKDLLKIRPSAMTILFLCFAVIILLSSIMAFPMADEYHWEMTKYWIQNKTIFPYPTINLRQTSLSFLRETAMLSNYFSICIPRITVFHEWLAYIFMYFVVASAGERTGFTRQAAVFGAFLTLSFSILIRAAFAGANDLLAAFFLFAAFFFLMPDNSSAEKDIRVKSSSTLSILSVCVALGIKNASIIIMPIYVIFFITLHRHDLKTWIKVIWQSIAVSVIGIMLSGFVWIYVSNYLWFGDFRGNYASTLGSLQFHDIATRCVRGLLYLISDFGYLPSQIHNEILKFHQFILAILGLNTSLSTEQGYFIYDSTKIQQRLQLGLIGSMLFLPTLCYHTFSGIKEFASTKIITVKLQFVFLAVATFVSYHAVLNWQPMGLVRLSCLFAIFGGVLLSIYYKNKILRRVLLSLAILNIILNLFCFIILVLNDYLIPDSSFIKLLNNYRAGTQIERSLVGYNDSTYFKYYDSTGSPDAKMLQEISKKLPLNSKIGIMTTNELNLFLRRPDLILYPLYDSRTYKYFLPKEKMDYIIIEKPYFTEGIHSLFDNKLNVEKYLTVIDEKKNETISVFRVK